MRQLDMFAFDPATHTWRDTEGSTSEPSSLSVVTWNVWFAEYERQRRWQALLDQVHRCQPDVIAFQEVTLPFLDLLQNTPWIEREYAMSDMDGRTINRYGVMMLSRIPVTTMTLHAMPSRMGRSLLVAHLGGSLAVSTIHLESLKRSRTYRDKQFAICVDILSEHEHAVFMGDMNFCSTWAEENARIPETFTDVWPALHPDDIGWSEDTSINGMLQLYEKRDKQVRYDRVFLRSTAQRWRPVEITRLGTTPIDGDPLLFPSDHFGLHARFTRAEGAP